MKSSLMLGFMSIRGATIGWSRRALARRALLDKPAVAPSSVLSGAVLLLIALGFAGVASHSIAQDAVIPPEHHVWGRFAPGSWTRVRVMSETTSPEGAKITSISLRKTTLVAVSEQGITLEVATTVEVSGSPVDTPPQTFQLTFDDLPAAEAAQLRRSVLGPGSVEIEGAPERCTIHQIEITDSATKTVIKRFYSADVMPHVLKCETIKTDRKNDSTIAETVTWLVARDVPYPLADTIHSTALQQETHKHASGSIRRLSLHAEEIPGGVLGESTKELDSSGKVIRRSTLDLLEFEVK